MLLPESCRYCGSCCRAYGIGLCNEDLEREPRLKELAFPVAALPAEVRVTYLARFDEQYYIGSKEQHEPCPFLYESVGRYLCSIYETRPNTCRRTVPSLFYCKIALLESRGCDMNALLKAWTHAGFPADVQVGTVLWIDPEKLEQFRDCAFASYEAIYYQTKDEFLQSLFHRGSPAL